jgi:uncharacterized membrane protein
MAGLILVLFPTVVFGGVSLLSLLIDTDSEYQDNPLRQDLWRAGHAHAGVLLILSLVALRYVDEAVLPHAWKWVVRLALPAAAILLPIAYFLSVIPEDAEEPGAIVYLAFVGAAVLIIGLITLGIGLLRKSSTGPAP